MSQSTKIEKPERLAKAAAMKHWRELPNLDSEVPAGHDLAKTMRSIPADFSGSTFTQDGFRITGTRGFIDEVLRLVKPLLERESGDERLTLNYQESTDRETKKPTGFWSCYIQVRERG